MRTVVLGASPNPDRYAYRAVKLLVENNHEVIAVGIKQGNIGNIQIQNAKPQLNQVHTITLYLGAERQKEYYDYILQLKPKRVIFNPGTANPELEELLLQNNIDMVFDCTLMMLDGNRYEL